MKRFLETMRAYSANDEPRQGDIKLYFAHWVPIWIACFWAAWLFCKVVLKW